MNTLSILVALVIELIVPQAKASYFSPYSLAKSSYNLPNSNCFKITSSLTKCYPERRIKHGRQSHPIVPDTAHQVLIDKSGRGERISIQYNTQQVPEQGHAQFKDWGQTKSLEWRAHKTKDELVFHSLIFGKEVTNRSGQKQTIYQLFYLNGEQSCWSNSYLNSLNEARKLADMKSQECSTDGANQEEPRATQ